MREIGVVEYLAEDALGQKMLHQHALYGFFREIGIDGLSAERVEVVEAADESRILSTFVLNQASRLLQIVPGRAWKNSSTAFSHSSMWGAL